MQKINLKDSDIRIVRFANPQMVKYDVILGFIEKISGKKGFQEFVVTDFILDETREERFILSLEKSKEILEKMINKQTYTGFAVMICGFTPIWFQASEYWISSVKEWEDNIDFIAM